MVLRLVGNPATASNRVPYEARGWCFFESTVASVGALGLETFDNGKDCMKTAVTPVPLQGGRFFIATAGPVSGLSRGFQGPPRGPSA